jgi:hypothetical protein
MRDLFEEPIVDGEGRMLEVSIDDCVGILRAREIEERLTEIDGELPLASDAQKDVLLNEKKELLGEFKLLGGKSYKRYRR